MELHVTQYGKKKSILIRLEVLSQRPKSLLIKIASDTLKNKKYFRAPILVLQLVTNSGLVPVPGRTNRYLEGPQ